MGPFTFTGYNYRSFIFTSTSNTVLICLLYTSGVEQRLAEIQRLQAEQAKSFSPFRVAEINTLKREVNQLSEAFDKNGKITTNHLITIKNYEYGMQAIATNSTRAMEKFVDAYGVGWSDIGQMTESGIEKQRIALEQARENYKRGLITKGTLEAIERQFEELVLRAEEAGIRVPQGIARGIKDGSGAAVNAMQNVVDQVTKTAKDGWKVNSPCLLYTSGIGYIRRTDRPPAHKLKRNGKTGGPCRGEGGGR